MAVTIAISGKGGSGKTTLAAMVIRYLCEKHAGTVLAVDADPNSCLGQTCGVEPVGTISEIREDALKKQPSDAGSDRVRSFEYGIQQIITEAKGFDLIVMGRPEGPGCYCAANNLLRRFLEKLSSSYDFIVIDNEAGMEHLSRRTNNSIDLLCIVAEPTPIGEITAQRIFELAKKLPMTVREIGVIWNKAQAEKKLDGIDTFGCIAYDKEILDISNKGEAIFNLDANNPAYLSLQKILEHKL